jgi:hypothetical protein
MKRKVCLLAGLCLAVFSAGLVRPVQAVCFPCDCVRCAVAPDGCCYALGQGNVTCSDWAAQSCPV